MDMGNTANYYGLSEEIRDYLFRHHTHRTNEDGSDDIVYREQDVVELVTLILNGKLK